jgi:hypothetical protein
LAPPNLTKSAAQLAHEQYLAQARARFLAGVRATTKQIDAIYTKAAHDVAAEMAKVLPTQPSAVHMKQIAGALAEAKAQLSDEVLDATMNGISLSTGAAISGASAVGFKVLGHAYSTAGLQAMYQAVNQRAVLAFATRTRFDGLRLSDRIWLAASKWQGYVQRATESAIAAGTPARRLAATLDPYLKAGTAKPSSLAVRRRLRIPKNISYQSLRVARTEMGTAFKEGTILGHSKTPSYLGAKWELSAGHPFQDDCDALASGGPSNDGVYPAGDEPMQPHPNCMCVLSPVHQDPEEFTDRLINWVNDPTSDPALEKWHQEVAKPFFNGNPINVPAKPSKVKVYGGGPKPKPGLKAAPPLPTPKPTSKQVSQLGPDVAEKVGGGTAPDVLTALEGAVQASTLTKAKAAAAKIDEAVDEVLDEAAAKIKALEDELLALENTGTVVPARSAREAAERHLAGQKRVGQPVPDRAEVELRLRTAGVDEVTLEERIRAQRVINNATENVDFAKAFGGNNRPSFVLTKRPINGNGGRSTGEVFGHDQVVIYVDEIPPHLSPTGFTMDNLVSDIRYQIGRARYRQKFGPSVQQEWQASFQNAKLTGEIDRLGGADRAEGYYGALFDIATTPKPATSTLIKKLPDSILEDIAKVEAQLGVKPNKAGSIRKLLGDKAKKAAAAEKKAVAEAERRALEYQKIHGSKPFPVADNAVRRRAATPPRDDDAWWRSITAQERTAVKRFTGPHSREMNRVMRQAAKGNGTPGPSEKALQRALTKKGPLPAPRLVYRGIGDRDLSGLRGSLMQRIQQKYKVGEPIRFDAFSSTSVDDTGYAASASSGDNGVLFEIFTRQGQWIGGHSSHPSEREHTLQAGARFRIRNILRVKLEHGGERVVVQLEDIS